MYITCSFLYLNDLRILLWKLQLPIFSRSVNYTSSLSSGRIVILFMLSFDMQKFFILFFKINLFIYLFIFGCVGSSFLCEGFL